MCMALHAYMRLFCNKPCLKFGLQRELCMVGILKLRMLSQDIFLQAMYYKNVYSYIKNI